jgi:hypothetical protein
MDRKRRRTRLAVDLHPRRPPRCAAARTGCAASLRRPAARALSYAAARPRREIQPRGSTPLRRGRDLGRRRWEGKQRTAGEEARRGEGRRDPPLPSRALMVGCSRCISVVRSDPAAAACICRSIQARRKGPSKPTTHFPLARQRRRLSSSTTARTPCLLSRRHRWLQRKEVGTRHCAGACPRSPRTESEEVRKQRKRFLLQHM